MNIKGLLLVLIVAVGCSKRGEQPPEHRPLPEGDFYKLAKTIYSEEKWLEDCDFTYRDRIYELTKDLDEKALQIKDIARSSGERPGYTRFEFGPGFFYKNNEPLIAKDSWERFEVAGWPQIHSEYLKVKGQAVTEENLRRWSWILRSVQGILVDDENRIVYGTNLALDHMARTHVPALKKIISACLDESLCSHAELEIQIRNAGLREWVVSIPYYEYFLNQIKQNGRSAMERFLSKRLVWDERRFISKPYDLAYKGSDGELVVPLHTSDFGGVKKSLEQFFIEPWVRAGLSISILWRESIDTPSVFKILYGDSLGGRAYVSFQDRHMKLYAGTLLAAFAHEFGHVLGLRDEYYTLWNGSTCSYSYDANKGNIMSDHNSGAATPELVSEIRSLYGL